MKKIRAGFLAFASVALPINSDGVAQAPAKQTQTLEIETVYPPFDMRAAEINIPSKKLAIDADLLGPFPTLGMTEEFKAQFKTASLTEDQITQIHTASKNALLERPDIKVNKGGLEFFVNADLLGDGPDFTITEAFSESLPQSLTESERCQILEAAQDSRRKRPDYVLELPRGGQRVLVDAHRLGSNHEATWEFILQFDPHYAMDRSAIRDLSPRERKFRKGKYLLDLMSGETDQEIRDKILNHMRESYGVTAEFIEVQRQRCQRILEAENVPSVKDNGPSSG
ncbi:MAG: hypothetical protein GC137_03960 [Alphaproteobacteria bacterium]|nr:hypothetical protein [Alphaproteobacteria bacterium]